MRWRVQSAESDPGDLAEAVKAFGPGVEDAVRGVQGLLIHGEAVEAYGLTPETFDRTTLNVGDRLRAILRLDGRPLTAPREPALRSLGTCRDYALMTCAVLRGQGRQARVRCGFAAYLGGQGYEDHWLCEVRDDPDGRWRRIDAQLDPVLRRTLSIAFDPLDLPAEAYLTADAAWRRCRSGAADPEAFRHGGEASGLWFLRVNVVRDGLALNDQATSAWDGWRRAKGADHELGDAEIAATDALAADPEAAQSGDLSPPW